MADPAWPKTVMGSRHSAAASAYDRGGPVELREKEVRHEIAFALVCGRRGSGPEPAVPWGRSRDLVFLPDLF